MILLTDAELQDFRDRALQASIYGYEIALADLYVIALAAEAGQEIVPEDVHKGSAAHLLGLADAVLAQRASGGKKPVRAPKASHRAHEPKVEEPAKVEEPTKEEPKVEDIKKDETPKPEAKDEEPKKEAEPEVKLEEPKKEAEEPKVEAAKAEVKVEKSDDSTKDDDKSPKKTKK
jgi:outer membrane biosynthesis protein TonB